MLNVAVIGAGISGLSAAYYLRNSHRVTVFESSDRIGGHTATKDVRVNNRSYAIDTGFIVYNDWTYPKFIALLDELGVQTQPTEMSFSVSCDTTGLEYGGNNLNSLFAQRRNLFRPKYWRMIFDILRFNRESIEDLEQGRIADSVTLGEYLELRGYSESFIEHYLIPMGCAIWSASTAVMMDFPLLFFVRFFKNHGLLSVNDRPTWRVIKGGSRSYLAPMQKAIEQSGGIVQTSIKIDRVIRRDSDVVVRLSDGSEQIFDQLVFACHSDQALELLGEDVTSLERELLGAIPYQMNEVVLHTDSSLLPEKKLAWSSWNYRLRQRTQQQAVLTYNMNILQGLESSTTFCVTLNDSASIEPSKILGTYHYAHPVFSLESVAACARWQEINGVNKTWFCGAYWANGFHEDGVMSGRRVADALNCIALEAPGETA